MAQQDSRQSSIELREQYLVVGARGYPDPVSFTQLEDACRLANGNGGRVRARWVSNWTWLDPEEVANV